MITGPPSCYPNGPQGLQMYGLTEDDVGVPNSSLQSNSADSTTHSHSLLYNLSLLKDKVHQVTSLVSLCIPPDHQNQPAVAESTSIAIANMGTIIQEIIVAASSMMFACQQLSPGATSDNNTTTNGTLSQPNCGVGNRVVRGGNERDQQQGFYSTESFDWFADNNSYKLYNTSNPNDTINRNSIAVSNNTTEMKTRGVAGKRENNEESQGLSPTNYDIIELDAADLLAKYTHYCQVCGKGFKRDANLRMHMRAHGDEYKSSAALSNPAKNNGNGNTHGLGKLPRKYSCPHEGCRWNKKHAKFQPLKSMICVKNHYKRSHCPKMYVCNRCNRKQFSVLSDLRTHEKHCGDLKWQCSCGTTFSRKDKLMGHVALFVGHTPAITSLNKMGHTDPQAVQTEW